MIARTSYPARHADRTEIKAYFAALQRRRNFRDHSGDEGFVIQGAGD